MRVNNIKSEHFHIICSFMCKYVFVTGNTAHCLFTRINALIFVFSVCFLWYGFKAWQRKGTCAVQTLSFNQNVYDNLHQNGKVVVYTTAVSFQVDCWIEWFFLLVMDFALLNVTFKFVTRVFCFEVLLPDTTYLIGLVVKKQELNWFFSLRWGDDCIFAFW